MNPEDLDRILASEQPLAPSSGFVASVMERALERASAPPLPFPWRRFLFGLLVSLALGGICGWIAVRLPLMDALAGAVGAALAAFADPRLSPALAEAAAALAGTYLVVRLTLGLSGR
ncbi:MAG TPA: hypothetical protein VGH73_00990 [Thermoanaerobaculia bacterium]|jgi:hypothetical protein